MVTLNDSYRSYRTRCHLAPETMDGLDININVKLRAGWQELSVRTLFACLWFSGVV
jgi:hypothetical protein